MELARISRLGTGLACCLLFLLCSFGVLCHAQTSSGLKYLEVKLVDPDGNPPKDGVVEVTLSGVTFPIMADSEGIASLNVPTGGNSSLSLKADCEGYATTTVSWNRGADVPETYEMKLQKAIEISGVVHDEDGNPVAGATVIASNPMRMVPGAGESATISGELGVTDEMGRWTYAKAPDAKLSVFVKLKHPDYLDDGVQHPVTNEQLRSGDHVLVLKKGIELRGTVTDPDGSPVEGVRIVLGKNSYSRQGNNERKTDEDGQFLFGNLPASQVVMTVYSPDFAPELVNLSVEKGMEPVDVQLSVGRPLRIKVVGPDGMPASGSRVRPTTWRGFSTLTGLGLSSNADEKGIYEWSHAPEDVIEFSFSHQDHQSRSGIKLMARDEQHEVTLNWPLEISGKVLDAESGEPVQKFQIVLGYQWHSNRESISWQNHQQVSHDSKTGSFNMKQSQSVESVQLRVEATGYKPARSRIIKMDEGLVELEFRLEGGTGPSGIVKLPDGSPAAGATVGMAAGNNQLNVFNGESFSYGQSSSMKTDDQGHYQLPFPDGQYKVVYLHKAGWAQADGSQLEESGDVKLKPWAQLKGNVKIGKNVAANESVNLTSSNIMYTPNAPQVYWSYQTKTDVDGNFVFPRLKSGSASVGRLINFGDDNMSMAAYTNSEQVELKSGETAEVQIGGTGRHVKGQIYVEDQFKSIAYWPISQLNLNEVPPQVNTVEGFFKQMGKALSGGMNPQVAAKVQQRPAFQRSYSAAFDEAGRFEIHDVAPGTYRLYVSLYKKPEGENFNWANLGNLNTQIVVPEGDEETIDLGEYKVPVTANDSGHTNGVWLPTPAPAE